MMRVLVVSDVRIVQEGLLCVLTQINGVDIISTVDNRHAKHRSAQLNPDIVLFDAARLESIGIVKDLVAALPQTKVVAFGVKEIDAEILALAAAGTAGCVRDSSASGEIVRVLEQILCDEPRCPRGTGAPARRHAPTLAEMGVANGSADTMPLSRRELEIAHLIENGLTNKAIGRRLGIEAATVKNHVHNMCDKLKVHRRGEMAARIRSLLGACMIFPASLPHPDQVLEAN
ncbi:MAG TPA: response regulator transcription factor [Steroidobacteraceae bacterium]|jgi:two-component system nitrate/nitrite response regulator NarL|nr:response regulator transcription factor [Steroidobacteraceae bacterium]